MVRAASLLYAIFISMVIAILCFSIVLLFSLNTNLDYHFNLKKRLLLSNQSGLAYLEANYSEIEAHSSLISNEKDIVTYFDVSAWGVFKKYSIISASKRDTIKQLLLVANKHNKNAPALYVRDNDEVFKISGKTKINGDIYISKKGLKKVNISGNSNRDSPNHNGRVLVSEKTLPKISEISLIYPKDFELLFLEDLRTNTLFNSFENKTKVLEVTTSLEDIKLKGNIIVRTNDTLVVHKSAYLEDIIIDAPKVIFREGFKGNLQVFASKEVVIESHTNLSYPSIIVVSSKLDYKKSIRLEEYARFSGALFIFGDGLKTEDKNTILINTNVIVQGDVYCDGKLSLYGVLKGSVFASAFIHEANATKYDNLIFNGEILSNNLPDYFFQIPILEEFVNEIPIFVKKL